MNSEEEAIDWATSFIERFEKLDEPLSKLHPEEVLEDGVTHLPFFVHSPDVKDFISGLYERGLIIRFDWGAWEPKRNYFEKPELLANAPLIDCLKLLTSHVRADRFVEGHLASVLEDGHITDILRRMREIREAGEPIDLQLETCWKHDLG